MSDYTTESPLSMERRQRRRRAVITIGTLVLGLFFAFWYGLSYYEAADDRAAARTPAPTCRPYDPEEVTPAEVTLNVLNATKRNGLAGRTAQALEQRGYTVDEVANDSSDLDTPKVAELRYGKAGVRAARLLLTMMPEGTAARSDKRDDATVDVRLGTDFDGLPPAVQSTQQPMCPEPSGSESASATPSS